MHASVWETIAAEAARESDLWQHTLLPGHERKLVAVFSPLGDPRYAVAIETIYEAYLVHYGRPRLFAPADRELALLLGDYLYAHGLVRVAAVEPVAAVRDLAELISLCAQARADGRGDDGPAWAATAALLGTGRLDPARAALRDRGDSGPLERLAFEASGFDAVAKATAAHRLHVD